MELRGNGTNLGISGDEAHAIYDKRAGFGSFFRA
jgi:hypothetical protein